MAKKPPGFHTPFFAEKDKLAALVKPPAKPTPAKPVAAPKPVEQPPERLFADAMAGVQPLEPDPRGRLGAPEPSPRPRVSRREEEDAEAYAMLADLVEGVGPFDISATDEYIEGIGPGIDRRILKKLKRGDYAVQAHLDLHGLTSEEARVEVERFLDAARAANRRCVLLIHGRGHNSKEGVPVLKERLKVWLTRGRIGHAVLAFATARPADGGAGAVYVLLRR